MLTFKQFFCDGTRDVFPALLSCSVIFVLRITWGSMFQEFTRPPCSFRRPCAQERQPTFLNHSP